MCRLLRHALVFLLSPPSLANDFAASQPEREVVESVQNSDWYDCSAELNIVPKLNFTNVRSDPAVVTKGSGQTIYKTVTYHANDNGPKELINIKAVLTQMYLLWNKRWITFLKTPPLNECAEHDGTTVDSRGKVDGPLCPLVAGTPTDILTVHPPLNPLTPYGLYRSRQVYRDGDSGEIIGCVDMRFWYCETVTHHYESGKVQCGQTRQQLRRQQGIVK